ncbi:hypothetical protein [Pseudonocardia sp. NPDC049635]|uniref:hypothetical protein n=1 Tax=Pseudonocardia sp. NPDC049635 TaxID=3155506 RepID=UPI0033C2640A
MDKVRARAGVWSRKGLVIEPPYPGPFSAGWALLTVRLGPRNSTALTHEQALHLRDWLNTHLDDTPPPADPDAVRAEIDEQIEQLTRLAADSKSGDYQTAMAWAQHALNKVAEAAGRKRTR